MFCAYMNFEMPGVHFEMRATSRHFEIHTRHFEMRSRHYEMHGKFTLKFSIVYLAGRIYVSRIVHFEMLATSSSQAFREIHGTYGTYTCIFPLCKQLGRHDCDSVYIWRIFEKCTVAGRVM